MSLFQVTKKQVIENYELRTMTGDIVSFTPSYSQLLPDPFSDLNITVNITATGGNGTPDNPNPINGYTETNIVNTQNDSIVDLFSIDSDFRGTVAFNQLVKIKTTTAQGINASIDANGVIEFSGTSTGGYSQIFENYQPIVGHKYYVASKYVANPSEFTDLYFAPFNASSNPSFSSKKIGAEHIANCINSTGSGFGISGFNANTDLSGTKIKAQFIDLTAMFGSTIADYIYTLEQNNAGEGVAFFRNIYPEDYYAYDSGTTEIVGKETPEATIAFGQTVYGGVLDVTRGKLTVTYGIVDLGDLTWEYKTGVHNYFQTVIDSMPDMKIKPNSQLYSLIADSYSITTSGSIYYGDASDMSLGGWDGKGFRVRNDDYSDAVTFKTAMSGHYVVYELATPFDIDLTPVQIRALVGENNVFADCGQTTVTCLI